MNDKRVVCVIDDDISAREAITGLVQGAGLEVEAFESAQAYLAATRTVPPSCLVLDVDLPGLSGLELQEQMGIARVDIPIVFVSGHSDVPMSVRALKAGALDFFTKPFDPDLLLSAIRCGVAEASRLSVAPARLPNTPSESPQARSASESLSSSRRARSPMGTDDDFPCSR